MKSVLVYSDAPQFGGHEAMTIEVARCLCQHEDIAVSFLFYEGNSRFANELAKAASQATNLTPIPVPFKSQSLEAFRSLLCVGKVRTLRRLMEEINPQVVVISQGRIEAGSLGLLAAKRTGLQTISYIPMAHRVSVSGIPVAVHLREWVNGYFYRLPNKFITISASAREMLLAHGATDAIDVVSNCIAFRAPLDSDRASFRTTYEIQSTDYAVGIVGRFDFRQKAQDFALHAIGKFRDRLSGYKFLLVGEGRDECRIREMIAGLGLSSLVQLLPWSENTGRIYAGLDMLLIPSKFEGVPLVMLEGMFHRLPIAATNADGMAELLPQNWLFPFGNHEALIDRVIGLRNGDHQELLEIHRKLVLQEFSSERFCNNVCNAILERQPSPVVSSR